MRIDWIIAVVIFLMFATWSFSYYSLISAGEITSRAGSALQAGEKAAGYMKIAFSSVPVNLTSASDTDNVTMWTYMNWAGDEKNSTRVVKQRFSAAGLDCMISGDKLFWEANLTSGDNYFFLEYGDFEAPLNCDQSLVTPDDNQTTMWAAESGHMFSSYRNSQVCSQINSSYAEMKDEIGITFDFNILIDSAGSVSTCGPPVPITGRDVFVFPAAGRLWEGGEMNMSVRLW
jgi:hypothetical protein